MNDTLRELLGSKRALLTVVGLTIVTLLALTGKLPAEKAIAYVMTLIGGLGASYAYSDTKPPVPPNVPPKG